MCYLPFECHGKTILGITTGFGWFAGGVQWQPVLATLEYIVCAKEAPVKAKKKTKFEEVCCHAFSKYPGCFVYVDWSGISMNLYVSLANWKYVSTKLSFTLIGNIVQLSCFSYQWESWQIVLIKQSFSLFVNLFQCFFIVLQLKLCLKKLCGWETRITTSSQMLSTLMGWLRRQLSATSPTASVLFPGTVGHWEVIV